MGVYIADPTARVWNDNKLYIYGSLDESTAYYCSHFYHTLSTDNLKDWKLHSYSFINDNILYAPDAAYKQGTYYLYYDTPNGHNYVAESDSPIGPFENGKQIEGVSQIDPNIFFDDDGQVYFFWGQFSAKGVKMNPDLKTLDMSTYVDGLVTEKEHYFHEGSYVIKRGKYYYFIYADISRKARPTCIGYAMATSPLGPYEYKGVIVDNAGCDPQTWNNHGSIVQYGEKWYILYHRSTHASRTMRKACIEPISFNPDGTINEVEMTSQGAGNPLDAFSRIDAARACWMQGNVRIRRQAENPLREELAAFKPGDMAVWKYLDFGTGASKATLRIKAATEGQLILRADSPTGDILGELSIHPTSNWKCCDMRLKKIKGVHALWVEFCGVDDTSKEDILSIDWFEFDK